MTPWLPVGLAAAAAVVLTGVPSVAGSRLASLHPADSATRRPVTAVGQTALAALAGLVLAGPVVAGLAAGGATVLRRAAEARRHTRDLRRERGRALEALSLLATDLRAGRGGADALHAAATVATGRSREALFAAASQARLGGDVSAALLVDGSAVPEVLAGLAACWSVCSAVGNGLAAGVERLEDGLRAAEAQRRAVETELAAPRATAALLAVLPLAGIWLAVALGAQPVHVLLHTPVGVACLALGVALDGLGLLWTGRLVARVTA